MQDININKVNQLLKNVKFEGFETPLKRKDETLRHLLGRYPTGSVYIYKVVSNTPIEFSLTQREFLILVSVMKELNVFKSFMNMFNYEHSWGMQSYYPELLGALMGYVMDTLREMPNHHEDRYDTAWVSARLIQTATEGHESNQITVRFGQYPACTCKQCLKSDIQRMKYNPIKIIGTQLFYRKGHKFLIQEAQKYERQFEWTR